MQFGFNTTLLLGLASYTLGALVLGVDTAARAAPTQPAGEESSVEEVSAA